MSDPMTDEELAAARRMHESNALREDLARDARNRALRTFLVGLGIDVGFAVTALVVTLAAADVSAWQGWAAVGVSVARTVVASAGAYVLRRFADPSRVPTPLPPAPVPAPADPGGA